MTAHELARKLLAGPDTRVFVNAMVLENDEPVRLNIPLDSEVTVDEDGDVVLQHESGW